MAGRNVTRVMVTGARAPAALEAARRLRASGAEVVAADCLAAPLARWSRAVSAYVRLPPPAADRGRFGAALANAARRERIDLVVPTCEEVFHLAAVRHLLPAGCRLLAPDLATLAAVHDKGTFAAMVGGLGAAVPATDRVVSRDALLSAVDGRHAAGRGVVVKRAFSRFATATLVRPSAGDLAAVAPSPSEPWVVQDLVEGRELCSYAVASGGRVTALAIYEPRHRAGKGAGTYLAPVADGRIAAFVSAFAARSGFDGQFGFDFIVPGGGLPHVIECNPRATSGIHLLPDGLDLVAAMDGRIEAGPWTPGRARAVFPATLASAALGGISSLRDACADLRVAGDVVWDPADPLPTLMQGAAFAEIALRGWLRGLGPLSASTADIEWNG